MALSELSAAEKAALARALEEHRARLLAILRGRLDRKLAGRLDAEDLWGDLYLRAQGKWRDHQAAASVSLFVWLYGLAVDVLHEARRKQFRIKRAPSREQAWPEESAVQVALNLLAPITSPSEAVAREEVREKVRAALNRLDDEGRELLLLRHQDQLSFPEIAEHLGVTTNAATLRYVRARDRLKELCRELGLQELIGP